MQGADVQVRKSIETEVAEYLEHKLATKRQQLESFPENAEERAKLRNQIEALESARAILFP